MRFAQRYGLLLLRLSLAVVFIWFGALKIVGMSPATVLVERTVSWFDPSWFVPFLGVWEVVIGLCFLYRPLVRLGIILLIPQMMGTFLPLVLLPGMTFQGSVLCPTMEGQYIIKNLVLLSAAMVIGSTVRDKKGKNR
jgi:uncharacterized membrane protein YkgB